MRGHAVGQVPQVQQQTRRGRRARAAAVGQHADQHELRRRGHHRHRQYHREPDRISAADRGRAVGDAHHAEGLRRERQRTGATLTDLARRAGIGKSTLSELESGAGNPSLETPWALAVALGVPVSRLLDPPKIHVNLIRAGEGPTLAAATADYRATLLDSAPPSGRRDLYRITAEPGEGRHSEPHMPGTIEHVILCSGHAIVGPTTSPETLQPGDYLSYPGDQPHTFRALTPATTAVLIQENT